MTPPPSVTAADALDDGDWFGTTPRRRYRVRPTSGGTWIVRRRGRVMLRTFAAALPPGLPDTDEALRRAWFAAVWPELDPRTRAEIVKGSSPGGEQREEAAVSAHQRRPSTRALKAALLRAGDNCSLCGGELRHGEANYSGYAKKRLEIVAECCLDRLDSGVYGIGVYFALDKAEPALIGDDREWFLNHPNRTHRLRPAHPGETVTGKTTRWVVVRQTRPGTRLRIGVDAPLEPADSEALAHALFDLLAEARRGGVSASDIAQRANAMQGGRA